jgi:hypothetical protein
VKEVWHAVLCCRKSEILMQALYSMYTTRRVHEGVLPLWCWCARNVQVDSNRLPIKMGIARDGCRTEIRDCYHKPLLQRTVDFCSIKQQHRIMWIGIFWKQMYAEGSARKNKFQVFSCVFQVRTWVQCESFICGTYLDCNKPRTCADFQWIGNVLSVLETEYISIFYVVFLDSTAGKMTDTSPNHIQVWLFFFMPVCACRLRYERLWKEPLLFVRVQMPASSSFSPTVGIRCYS